MDKQKQIEEMAKDICSPCHKGKLGMCEPKEGCVVWQYAKNAVEQGYRKIPEGAVALTKEEFEGYCETQKRVFDDLKRVRKETAEKFAERLKGKLSKWLDDNEDNNFKIDKGIAIIELIGVETLEGEVIAQGLIDEICKEIIGE